MTSDPSTRSPDGPASRLSGGAPDQPEAVAHDAAQTAHLHRALLDGMLDPLITIDQQGTIRRASQSVTAVFGYDLDELVGRNISLLMPEPHRSQHDSHLERYRETGITEILGTTREFQVVRKDGELLDVELSVSRVDVPDYDSPIFVGSFRDITARKRAQQRETSMLKALASLGESTAELVHEIKNPITAINMALRAVADQLGADEQQVLGELVGRLKRLEQQIRQSLSFARPLNLGLARCEADDLFDDVARFLRPLLSSARVALDRTVEPATPGFRADPARIEEVLTNLMANAMEMMPDGGRVRLSAGREDDSGVWLRVEDDGPGIDASVRNTLFRSFVTTKEAGTGLGLPICRRIVEEHGGSLDAEEASSLGGASFKIILPIHGPGHAVGPPAPRH